jgi:hypothetical protein
VSAHERRDIQRQLFLALRIADRNADAIAVLEDVVRSQASDPQLTRHSDEEWELIMAKWAVGADLLQLLAELELCSSCSTASVKHRLRAARYAFMIADNMSAPDSARRVYEAIREELASDESPDADKWYCEMVYHAGFGDVSVAVSFARRLFRTREALGDSRDFQLVGVHVADVLQLGGAFSDSLSLYECTYQTAREANLMWIACLTARRLAWQHFETGHLEQASYWAELALAHSGLIQHTGSAADSLAVAAEIALAYGRLTDAAELIERSVGAWGPSRHVRANAEGLALQCTLWIKEGHPEKCRAVIEELDATHLELCRRTGQDLLTARCASIHEALGDVPRARAAIERYLPYRRDLGPLSPELLEIVRRLELRGAGADPSTAIRRRPPFEHAVSPC